MKKLMMLLVAVLALLSFARPASASCGWCGFMPPNPCSYEWGTGFYCHHGFFNDCIMVPSDYCSPIANERKQSWAGTIEKWKQHEPRFYTAAATPLLQEWFNGNRGPVPHYLLSRFKVNPSGASPGMADALRQRTHYDAMRVLVRAGEFADDPLLVAALQ